MTTQELICHYHSFDPDDARFWMSVDTPKVTVLTAFRATEIGDEVEISWSTDAEYMVDYFVLLRADDAKGFKSIGKIKAKEGKDKKLYKLVDKEVKKLDKKPKKVRYRLDQQSLDGTAFTLGSLALATSGSTQPDAIEDLVPQITPKSPSVAAIERYGQYPVSHYTGIPNIEIPIYDIQVGDLTIPIRLAYHAGGNKVTDHASWVGLGWSVKGLYTITRQIRGLPDETDYANNNSLLQNQLPNYNTSISCLTPSLKQALNQHIDFDKDLERDIFTYQTPLKSNSFVLEPNNTIFLEGDKSKISYTGGVQDFLLTDDRGNRYSFDIPENTNALNVNGTSAWRISELQTTDPGEKVRYTYHAAETYTYQADRTYYQTWHTDLCYNPPVNHGLQAQGYTDNVVTVTTRPVHEIFFPGGKIRFVQSSTLRADGLGKALDKIEVFSYNFGTGAYQLIRYFDLVHINKTRAGSSQQVLFLDKVVQYDQAHTVVGEYQLHYNATALPAVTSNAKDHWGYYNGQSGNQNLLPAYSFNYQTTCNGTSATATNPSPANRNASATHMQAWILNRIDYPTGGHTSFTYEPHQHSGGTLAGGLRIKKMVSYNGSGQHVAKSYRYGTNGNGTYRDLSQQMLETSQKIKHDVVISAPDYYEYSTKTMAAGVNTMLNSFEGVPVTYPEVTEYVDSTQSSTNGRTVYTYRDSENDLILQPHPATSRQILQSKHWGRGQLLSKQVYNSSNVIKYREDHSYIYLVPGNATGTLGYIFGRTEVQIGQSQLDQSGCYVNDDKYSPIQQYSWYPGLLAKQITETYDYDDTNASRYVYQKTETDYDPNYYQPEEIRIFSSDGSIKTTKIQYCNDINATTSSTGPAAAIWQLLQNNELYRPIETSHYYQRSSSHAQVITHGQLNLDTKLTLNGGSYVLPDEIHLLEINPDQYFNTIPFAPAQVSGNTLQYDSKYNQRVVFDTYDNIGNLTKYHLPAGELYHLHLHQCPQQRRLSHQAQYGKIER